MLFAYSICAPAPGLESPRMTTDFYLSALDYFQQGLMTMPLTLDAAGFPKRPIVPEWSRLPYSLDALKKLPWEEAKGIGLLLGPASKGIAVIDLDDIELAEAAAKWTTHTRTIKTVRGRGHVYVRERTSSKSRAFNVLWKGRQIKIELKGNGTQVACPPTPGYAVLSEGEPREVDCIATAWAGLARCLGIEYDTAGEGYPKPWQDKVPVGERNKSAYVEAHFLRGARMPLPLALRIMQLRWEADYEKGEETWDEVARTVESAYTKGSHPPISDVCADIEWT